MTRFRPGRDVMVVGVGLHPFGRFPEKDLASLARDAVIDALKDAGIPTASPQLQLKSTTPVSADIVDHVDEVEASERRS